MLDPFLGTGTTSVAAARCGRNSIGIEVEPSYVEYSRRRIEAVLSQPQLAAPEQAATANRRRLMQSAGGRGQVTGLSHRR